MSQITTHVLDTSRGKPAIGLPVSLHQFVKGEWAFLARGATDSDGRIVNLLVPDKVLEAGVYKLNFNTQSYFDANGDAGFFPFVDISFNIEASDGQHYHVPLLLSAFAYSTYRGS